MVVVNQWLILFVYICTFLVGLPSNILAMSTLFKKLGDKPNPTDVLLFNLVVSDLIFLCFLPLKMYEAVMGMKWYLSKTLCSMTAYVFFTTIYSSSLLLMAIAVDRYFAVVFPIKYRNNRKPVYAMAGSVLIWLIAGSNLSLVIYVVQMPEPNGTAPRPVCYDNFTEEQKRVLMPFRLELFMLLYLVPLLICIFCYASCIYFLYTRPLMSKDKKQRAIGMAFGTLSIFLVCFLPYNVSHLITYSTNMSPSWRAYALLMCTLNTSLDPIVFYFSSSTFRDKNSFSVLNMLHIGLQKVKDKAIEMNIISP